MSRFCRTDRLWLTRLSRDFPGINYHEVSDTAVHAYIALYAAENLIDGVAHITVKRPGAHLVIDDIPPYRKPSPNVIVQVKIKEGLVENYRTFLENHPPASEQRRGMPIEASFVVNRNLLDVAEFVVDVIETMGFNYTDMSIYIR